MSLTFLNSVIYGWERPEARLGVLRALNAVVAAEATSTNPEDVSYIVTVAKQPSLTNDVQIFSAVARTLRVVLQRPWNSTNRNESSCRAIVHLLEAASKLKLVDAAVDACYALLLCATADDLCLFTATDGTPACVRCLSIADAKLHIVACACLQTLVTSSLGLDAFVVNDGSEALVALLYSGDEAVVTRALAVLHTSTVDLRVTQRLALIGGIHLLVQYLGSSVREIVLHASGALQNISRDKDCRSALESSRAVEGVATLLDSVHSEVQASVVGVLLNMHTGDQESRKTLKRVLAMTIAASLVESTNVLAE